MLLHSRSAAIVRGLHHHQQRLIITNVRRNGVALSASAVTREKRRQASESRSSSPYVSSKRSTSSTTTTNNSNTVSKLPPIPDGCHRFVLMRHGESAFNNANIFTGWCDVALTQRGIVEAVEAGEVFESHSLKFRNCYVSLLSRSIVTAHRTLESAGIVYTPLVYDYRWNERHYGALQGLSKERTAQRIGRNIVMKWRRSYTDKPPPMTEDHPHYQTIHQDPRYQHLSELELPRGESLEDCQQRVIEVWKDTLDEINLSEADQCSSLVVAHANTLRALVMYLDNIDSTKIESLNIPTAIPFFYDICISTGNVVSTTTKTTTNDQLSFSEKGTFRGMFITDERKQRCFLERRRAANDPWMWALHDDQVASSMLSDEFSRGDGSDNDNHHRHVLLVGTETKDRDSSSSDMKSDDEPEKSIAVMGRLEEEARKNTKLFAPDQSVKDP